MSTQIYNSCIFKTFNSIPVVSYTYLNTMISKRFILTDIQSAMNHLKDDRENAVKAVMVNE